MLAKISVVVPAFNLAGVIGTVLASQLDAQQLQDWGWRLAMLIGAAQFVVVRARLSVMKWSEPAKVPLSDNRVLITGSKESSSLTR